MTTVAVGALVFAMSISGNPPGNQGKAEKTGEAANIERHDHARGNGEAAMDKMTGKMTDKTKTTTDTTSLGARLDAWPAASRDAANAMIAKYGQPDEVTEKKVMWNDKGMFKRIFVSREPHDHQFPMPHQDVLGQSVDYKVPPEMFDDLAMFDGSITADRTKGSLTATCDREEMNYAALNLADDIVRGKKTVAQAREALARAAEQVKAGNPPLIAQRLQFDAPAMATADADKPATRAMGQ